MLKTLHNITPAIIYLQGVSLQELSVKIDFLKHDKKKKKEAQAL